MARAAVDPRVNGSGAAEEPWTKGRNVPVIAAPRRRRSRGLIALGIALMAACGAGTVTLFNASANLAPSVGVAIRVPFGGTITEADLVQVQVHPDPAVRAIPWAQRSALIGQRAATDLLPGSVVTPEVVGGAGIPEAGQALVGIAVKANQLPTTPLAPRDRILLVATDGPAGGETGTAGAVVGGSVVKVSNADGSGIRVVDVQVLARDAGPLAARAAAGRIAVVLQPRG